MEECKDNAMKVLQINAIYGAKSTGIITKEIHEMLETSGATSIVVAPQYVGEKPRNGYRIGNVLDYKYHALMTRIFGRQAYSSKISTRRFIRFLKRIKPDIIHLHNIHGNYINFNMLFKYVAEADVAVVITLHDCWYFTGKCFHYMEEQCEKWKTECCKCVRNKKDVCSWFWDSSRKVFRDKKSHLLSVDNLRIVGPSQWICDEVKQSFLGEKEIICIPNGIDTNVFRVKDTDFRKKHSLENKFIIMGMADKWLHKKNVFTVNEILKSLGAEDVIVLVGVELHDMPYHSKKIIAIPYISDRDYLADLYNEADVFVNLTLADTFPTVNMEAICCGTPVVTYDVGGSAEIIDEMTGVAVPVGDTQRLLSAIKEVKEKEFRKCSEIGKIRFSKEKCYDAYKKLYYRILDEKNERGIL